MRFILEHQQPVFFTTIDIYLDLDAAGVDLITDFHIVQLPDLTHIFTGNGRHVHQCHDLTAAMYFFTQTAICFICLLDLGRKLFSLDLHILQDRFKRRMAAMIRPICVQYFQLCQGQITLLFFLKIFLYMYKICQRHRQSLFFADLLKTGFFQHTEAFQNRNRLYVRIFFQTKDMQIFFTHFYRVDQIVLHRFHIFFG